MALNAPLFPHAVVHLAHGRELTISAPAAAPGLQAIAGARVDGRPWNRTYVDDSLLSRGGSLTFDLTSGASAWGTAADSAAPSTCRASSHVTPRLSLGVEPKDVLVTGPSVKVVAHVNATGPGTVTGKLGDTPFSIESDGLPAQQDIPLTLDAPSEPGDHAVTLTAVTDGGLKASATVTLHVVRTGCAQTDQACLVPLAYDKDGIATAAHPDDGNFDGGGWSFPAEELPPAGPALLAGTVFSFPSGADGASNMIEADGQTLPLPGVRASALHVLASAHNGSVDSVATVTYADGTTASVPLRFGDWAGSPAFDEKVAVTTPYRYKAGVGKDAPPVSIFASTEPLDGAKTVQSITLPAQPHLKLFALTLSQAAAS